MATVTLEFEKPIVELEERLAEWETLNDTTEIDVEDEIALLRNKIVKAKVKPELLPNTKNWDQVLKALKDGYKMAQINAFYFNCIKIRKFLHICTKMFGKFQPLCLII